MRRRLRLLFVFTIGGFLAVVGFNYCVNPFGLWAPTVVAQQYTKAGRDLVFPGHSVHIREEARVVLIGSSRTRTGFWVPSVCRDGVLNTGVPNASLADMELVAEKIGARDDVQRVIIEASFFMVLAGFVEQDVPDLVERLEGDLARRVTETLASRGAVQASVRKLRRSLGMGFGDDGRTIPWPVTDIAETVRAMDGAPAMSETVARESLIQAGEPFEKPQVLQDRLQRQLSIARNLRASGKDVVFFVPPVTEYRLEMVRQHGLWDAYCDWKAELVAVAPTWDFGRSGALSIFEAGYRDVHHFRDAIGWLMMRRMLGQPEAGLDPISLSLLDAARYYDQAATEAVRRDAPTRIPNINKKYAQVVADLLATP